MGRAWMRVRAAPGEQMINVIFFSAVGVFLGWQICRLFPDTVLREPPVANARARCAAHVVNGAWGMHRQCAGGVDPRCVSGLCTQHCREHCEKRCPDVPPRRRVERAGPGGVDRLDDWRTPRGPDEKPGA